MSKLYSINVRLWATAYIVADSEREARKIIRGMAQTSIEVPECRECDIPITGEQFNRDMPEVSLSPAMEIGKPEKLKFLELVEDFGDDEDDEDDGTNGQDRQNYTDDQDRESYSTDP